MKTKITILTAAIISVVSVNAAVNITGAITTGLGAGVPAGTLVMLIVDSSSDGFLGTPSFAGDLTATNDPGILPANTSTTVGSFYGGDLILGKLNVTSPGALPGGFTWDNVASIQGRGFALVYFPSLTLASASVPGGTPYGIVRGADWILPSVNGGETFTVSASSFVSDTVFARVTVAAGVATNDIFTTSSGAAFTTVAIPEPTSVLLGAIGAFGFLRRRRN